MSEEKIEMGKQYRTRDGRAVRVLCVDLKHDLRPVIAAVSEDLVECVYTFSKTGRYQVCDTDCDLDLIEVKPRIKRKVWLNVYPARVVTCETKEVADACAGKDRIACVPVTLDVEEGHGL